MISTFSGKHRFLSNFHPCTIVYEGIQYPSTEHAYQAAKTDDRGKRIAISWLPSPGNAKRHAPAKPDDWHKGRGFKVMSDITHLKYQIPELRELLLKTGDEELVEGNTHNDTYWGVCRGVGKNYLGIILMRERAHIRGETLDVIF